MSPVGTTSGDEVEVVALDDITVIPSTDEVEMVIGVDGGSVSAVDSDGTTYELVIPPGSLGADTTIVMTPARLDGVPFPTSTVMFEPTGLEFISAASLTITPAADVPIETRLLYGLNDDATEFVAAFPEGDGTANTIVVPHFSGYGVANVTTPERAALLERGAAETERALESSLAEAVQNLPRDSDGYAPGFNELLDELFEVYENEVLAPRLEAASASCAAAQRAVTSAANLERSVALVGRVTENETFRQTVQTASAAGGACEEEAIAKCKEAKDPQVLVQFWLFVDRASQLFGGPSTLTTSIADLIKRAKRICDPVTYTASGGDGEGSFSGTVESYTEPFTVDTTFIGGTGFYAFVPSSETAGSVTVEGSGSGARFTGTGSYTVTENDDGTVTVSTNTNSCVDVSGECRNRADTITLTPNE